MLHGFSEELKKKKKTSSQIYEIQFVSLAKQPRNPGSSTATEENEQFRSNYRANNNFFFFTEKKNEAAGLLYTR